MALIKTHPDYMAFKKDKRTDRYPVEHYTDLLDYIKARHAGEFWLAQPSDIARYWRELRPLNGKANRILASATLCSSCRQAHGQGWLSDYPHQTVASGCPPALVRD
jgi:hypothetical protein